MQLSGNKVVFGFAMIAVTTALIYYLSATSDQVASYSVPATDRPRSSDIPTSASITTTEMDNTLKQLVVSGQLSRPPGNPAREISVVLPFGATQRTTVTSTPVVEGQSNVNIAQAAQRVDSTKPVNQGIGAQQVTQTQSPLAPSKPKTDPSQSQAVEFETPPGVGSPRGSS